MHSMRVHIYKSQFIFGASFHSVLFVKRRKNDCVVINTSIDLCPQMANALRNRLLHAIAADDAVRGRDDDAHDIAAVNLRAEEQWWDHLITNFFHHDETALFTDRRLDKGVFNVLLNAIEDLPLQTRGRRSFAHSHREQLLVLHVLPAFGTSVPALLVAPAPGASQRHRRVDGRSAAGV